MIKPLSTALLLPAELVDAIKLYQKTIKICAVYDPAISKINVLLKDDLRELIEALTVVPYHQPIEDLCEAEALRDTLYDELIAEIHSFRRKRKIHLKSAYQHLRDLLEAACATAIPVLMFGKQCEKYEAFFAKLTKSETQPALATLGIERLCKRLMSTHADLLVRYHASSNEDMSYFMILREAKITAVQHLNELMAAMAKLEKQDKVGLHSDFIEKFNAVTSAITLFIKERKPQDETE